MLMTGGFPVFPMVARRRAAGNWNLTISAAASKDRSGTSRKSGIVTETCLVFLA
jgi:hypothetical protein